MFKFHPILVLLYEEKDYHKSMQKIFHSHGNLIASDSYIDRPFTSMHQKYYDENKKFAAKDWVFEAIVKHSIKIFECQYRKMEITSTLWPFYIDWTLILKEYKQQLLNWFKW